MIAGGLFWANDLTGIESEAIEKGEAPSYRLEDKGGNGIMFGIIAQDLIDKLADNGIDFEQTPLVADLDNEEESLYSVDYVQFLLARLAADEDRIGELEEKIEERKQA